MAKTIITQITDCIERIFEMGGEFINKTIIYPCGDIGIQVASIMRDIYSIEPAYILDNHKSKYTDNIHDVSFLKYIDTSDYVLLLSSTNSDIYGELMKSIQNYFSLENII